MNEFLVAFFSQAYMPHGYCFLWESSILWLNVGSDIVIAIAYFTIPFILFSFVKLRKDLEFKGIFILFAIFIFACGITHLISIYTIWFGAFGIHGLSKAITAIASIATAIAFYRILPQLLAIPSVPQLGAALREAADERVARVQSEAKRDSEEIFKFSTELVPTALLVIDEDRRIKLCNGALEDLFGFARDELIGAPLSKLIEPEMAASHDALARDHLQGLSESKAMAGGRIVEGIRKDGSKVKIQIRIAVKEFQGRRHAFASIEEGDLAQSELSKSLEILLKLNRAIQASSDGVWEWNILTGEIWANRELKEMIGVDPETSHSAEQWAAHIHPDDRDLVNSALEKHLADKAPYNVVYRGKDASGTYRWIRTRGQAMFDDAGQPILMSGIQSDITQLKEIERELAETNEDLQQFAYSASHDLKAPLRAMKQLTSWIEEEVSDAIDPVPPELKRYLGLLHSRADRLHNLLDALLEYSKIGRKEIELEQLDWGKVVSDAASLVSSNPNFDIAISSDLETAPIDRTALEQITMNLVSNAIKHHDLQTGKIDITIKPEGEEIVLTISDDGPGIPVEYHNRIFEMYQTLRPRDEVEGSGMGLALVKRLVDRLDGHIEVLSNAPTERGTVFKVTFPSLVG